MTAIVWIDVIIYLFINASNIWIFWGDTKLLCFCFVTYAFGFTGLIRIYTAVAYCPTFYEVFQTIYRFAKTFDRKVDLEEIELYKKYGYWCKRIGIINTIWFVIVGVLMIIYPGIIFLINGTKTLSYGFIIPGISYKENPGYAINFLYQSIQSVFVMTGFMGCLHILFLFVMNACFQVDLIIVKLQKLDRQINVDADASHEEAIIKIIQLYQDFIDYMGKIELLFSIQVFVDFVCFTFQNVVTLYVLVSQVWILGYTFEVNVFILLLIPSVFGAMIEAKNDRLINEIYAVSWYLLNVKDRKSLRFFLETAQNASMLSCGGFIPLNVVLFKKTYSRIYSYLMFLKDSSR